MRMRARPPRALSRALGRIIARVRKFGEPPLLSGAAHSKRMG